MPMSQAHKLCPNGYYVRARFDVYREVSSKIMEIFKQYTEIVEPLALDEAYLDITHLVKPHRSASKIASNIRKDIFNKTGLTSSAGVSYNKYLAKLASGMNKPNGMMVIHYQNVHDILMNLDIGDFPGVEKLLKIMHEHDIYTGKDLYSKSEFELIRWFGKKDEDFIKKQEALMIVK